MYYILAYGSLRMGAPWYQELKHNLIYSDQISYVSTIGLKGFKLFKVKDPEEGSYHDWTAAKFTGDEKDTINADIVELTPELYNYVKNVIEHSDFVPLSKIVGNKNCEMFIYNGKVEIEDEITNGTNSKGKEIRLFSESTT